jgi:sialidase-1
MPDEIFQTVLRRQGQDDVHTYRIPGLATTPAGTLIAVFDVRRKSAGDLPGDIDVGMMRSTDQGRTWSKMQIILDFEEKEAGSRGNGVGDPAVLVDRRSGHILVVGLWSKGDRGWHGSGPGLAPDETGQLVLALSTDDGKTWSPPINITRKIAGRDPKWRLCFNGPGSGIQLRSNGTLVFAAQFRDAGGIPHSCFIFSSDGGHTWAISPPAIPTYPPTSEAQVAELADGSLLLSMRDEARNGKRAWARYTWKGDLFRGKWSDPWFVVPDPTCMASLVRYPQGPLLFSNPNSVRERVALTIRTSTDEGKTWSAGRLLDPRPSAYSCLSVLSDGSVGVLYECGDKSSVETLTFTRFPRKWVEGNDGPW